MVSKPDCEKATLTLKLDELKLGLQRFAGSDEDILFCTGFPNYSNLITFYEFFLPAADQLNYWGTDNADNRILEEKHGPIVKYNAVATTPAPGSVVFYLEHRYRELLLSESQSRRQHR